MKLTKLKSAQASPVLSAKLATSASAADDSAFSIPVQIIQNVNSPSKPNPPAISVKNAAA